MNQNLSKSLLFFSIAILTLGLFFLFFHLLENNDAFYDSTIGLLEESNAATLKISDFFVPFKHGNLKHWDTSHYYEIGTEGYTSGFQYAFFPLYPFILGLVQDLVFQVFLNYVLYISGLFFILKSREDFEWSIFNIVALFCAPFLFVILIPYSEALMIFCFGFGWYLKKKNSKWIYPIFFCLSGMIRASNVFMIACFGLAGLFILWHHRNSFKEILKQFDWVIYIALGVLCASVVQFFSGASHLLFFVEAQSYWEKNFTFPTRIVCWSDESLGLNSFVLFVLFPLFIYKIKEFYQDVKSSLTLENTFKWSVLIYLILLTVLIYMTQIGSLNGLFRYVCCTPFFLLILNKKNNKLALYFLFFLTAFFFYNSHVNVHGVIGPSQLGFFIFFLFILLTSFKWNTENKLLSVLKYTLLGVVFSANLLFTSICLYKFLANSYVIT